jgi:DNA invertase Pin-like site-specific DNA recombinase
LAKHTAIYTRVSSRSQDTQSQEPDLKRWAGSQPEGQTVRWYRDRFTGKTMDRPGFNRLTADLQAGKVDRVVVWRLDRLGRTAQGLRGPTIIGTGTYAKPFGCSLERWSRIASFL